MFGSLERVVFTVGVIASTRNAKRYRTAGIAKTSHRIARADRNGVPRCLSVHQIGDGLTWVFTASISVAPVRAIGTYTVRPLKGVARIRAGVSLCIGLTQLRCGIPSIICWTNRIKGRAPMTSQTDVIAGCRCRHPLHISISGTIGFGSGPPLRTSTTSVGPAINRKCRMARASTLTRNANTARRSLITVCCRDGFSV